ncbi:hypothetical protein C8R46DRAFT_1252913 [Mycena filopes]|nr:hypothetical protein C8R46DRAFT_1252913 [Mycena filopes]
MPSLKGTLMNITSYRLGYTLQRPYPWRWATPAILGVFLLISVFLALVNIPLSAYEIVQESTYRPNDSLPPLLFSGLLPGLLQSPEDTFAPHILTVGENLVVNNSMLNITIIGACHGTKIHPRSRHSPTITIPFQMAVIYFQDVATRPSHLAPPPLGNVHVERSGRGWWDPNGPLSRTDRVTPGDSFNTVYRFLILPGMNNAFQNVFQSLYHLAPGAGDYSSGFPMLPLVAANKSRTSTSNATLMKEWADIVHMFNTTDRVPVISYLRPVPHLKPLGSALTSVFVSTFAMVSVLWTIFSLIAGIIATRSESPSTERTALSQLAECLNTHGVAIARMELALKKQGLFEDDDEEGDLESSTAYTSNQEEKAGLLVHRTQADSYSVV